MNKRRVLRWSLILVSLAAFAIWLEPTRVVWGWLRGEAFYQGRPTSWWRYELGQWRTWGRLVGPALADGSGETVIFARFPTKFEAWLGDHGILEIRHRRSIAPPLLNGDRDATAVLKQLSLDAEGGLKILVDRGLQRIENEWQTDGYPDWFIRHK